MYLGSWFPKQIFKLHPSCQVGIDFWQWLQATVAERSSGNWLVGGKFARWSNRDKRMLLFPASQQPFIFLCLITLVFSGLIHELKMSEKIIYIYIYWQIGEELPAGFVWQILIVIHELFTTVPLGYGLLSFPTGTRTFSKAITEVSLEGMSTGGAVTLSCHYCPVSL